MLKKVFLLVFCLGFHLAHLLAQVNIHGAPFITNHSSIAYQYHPRNFCALQDDRGIMYFGNAYGILEYDGFAWNRIDLPDGKSAISLAKDDNGKIYVGSVGEFGFLEPDSLGQVNYVSLINRISQDKRNFGEVWKTFIDGNRIYFCAYQQITVIDGDKVSIFHPRGKGMAFDFFARIYNKICFRESGIGLVTLNGDNLELISGGDQFSNHVVFAMEPLADDDYLVLSERGLGKFGRGEYTATPAAINSFIANNSITDAVSLSNEYFALGTGGNGIKIFDQKGNSLQQLTRKNGLPNNYIYDLYRDNENNLWACTDNGISHILISSPFTAIGENDDVLGMGYASYVYGDRLFLGTSAGLFSRPWDTEKNNLNQLLKFEMIKGLDGQVWNLGEAREQLLIGHNRGLYQLVNNEAIKISPGDYTGGWTFVTTRTKPYVLLGTYEGIEVYELKGTRWTFRNKIKGFLESARTFLIDNDNNMWVCHGNKGLFRLVPDPDFQTFTTVQNLCEVQKFPADYFNDIAWIDNQLVFAADDRAFIFDSGGNQLVPFQLLNQVLPEQVLIGKLGQHRNGNIWYVNKDLIELLIRQPDGSFTRNNTIFSKLKSQLIGSYEYYWQFNDNHYFIGTQSGFVHFNSSVVKRDAPFEVLIRKVESINHGDSVFFAGTFRDDKNHTSASQPESAAPEIPFQLNALRFSYTATFYEDSEKTLFQYALQKKGEAPVWSEWTTDRYKEYSNLREANYVFHIRAKNIHSQFSADQQFAFRVLPPWYRTTYAYIAYAIIGLLGAFLASRLVKQIVANEQKRMEKEKARELLLLERQFAEESLKAEKEIILLQNEKLAADVKYKNDELAYLATILSQKTEFLSRIKKELVAVNRTTDATDELDDLIKSIDKDNEFDDGWNHFQANFDNVHHNFLYKMREQYPILKSTDLLLCAYIKINKSNKEISSLLNISVSAVEKRRFRLREKLKLDNDTKLTEFLMQI